MVVFLALALCLACQAQTSFVGLVGDELAECQILFGNGVKVGPDVAWFDGLDSDAGEGWRFGIAGTYDVISNAPAKLFGIDPNATVYVGGVGGAFCVRGEKADATAALTSGLRLIGGNASIGIQFQYLLTRDLWKELADIPDDSRVLFEVEWRF